MLEVLCRRKRIRNFLNLYSSDKWTEIIPYVVEIAILNLKNSFGTLLFDKDEFSIETKEIFKRANTLSKVYK